MKPELDNKPEFYGGYAQLRVMASGVMFPYQAVGQ